MLVVRRRAGETLLIGDSIEIEILEVTASQVKIGIQAPKDVKVLRKEIRITGEQNRAAAHGKSEPAMNSLLEELKKRGGAPIRAL
jgi:carbon storage regulator